MRPTIRLVAAEAGVSTATVSYVLSGRAGSASGPGVSPGTIERVHQVAERLGYRPNQAARTIRTGKSNLLMLSLTMLSDPWSLAVSRSVGAMAAERGITPMILADTDWRVAIRRQNADVVFLDAAKDPEDADLLAELSKAYSLVVFSETLEPDGFDVIRSVAGPACGLAVDHLAAGHRKIGCLTGVGTDLDEPTGRYGAYVAGLGRAGIPFRPQYVARFEWEAASAFAAAASLLALPDRPTAIYATTDFAAMAAIQAAQHLRLRVPEDVAVIGVGNTTEGEVMTPSLSTVGPVGFFDRLAAILLERAEDPEAPRRLIEFPWQLLVRESAPAAVAPDSSARAKPGAVLENNSEKADDK